MMWASPAIAAPLPIPGIGADLTVAEWWVIGRWVGDGWTAKTGPTGQRGGGSNAAMICCAHDETEYLNERLAETRWTWRPHHQKTTDRFRTCDASLRNWLREQFGTSAATKRIPAWLLGADTPIRRAFLAGYVSADGWDNGHHVSCHTVSSDLALGLRALVGTLGYGASVFRAATPGAAVIEGREVATRQAWRVDWPTTAAGGRMSQTRKDDDHVWGRIRSVTHSPVIVPVYDLEVEEDHSFIADGVVVHNCCQRLDLPPDQPGTWQVTFDYGVAPPSLGRLAAAELGYQLYLAVTPAGAGKCRLPARVTNITRQGMSAVLLDPQVFLDKGRTGLSICDYFIEMTNPHGLRRRSTAWTPDIGRRVSRIQ